MNPLKSFVKRCTPRWAKQRIKNALRRAPLEIPAPVLGLGEDAVSMRHANGSPPRRALVSYLTKPFRIGWEHPDSVQFSNLGIARSMVRALNELGYAVDVIEYFDKTFVPARQYDLFLGHRTDNFASLAAQLKPEAPRIYYVSTMYWADNNARTEERYQALEERRGVALKRNRTLADEDGAMSLADAVFGCGNERCRRTYAAHFPGARMLNNAAYADDHFERTAKEPSQSGSHFFFFAGSGNVHKGLDLLLEAFKDSPAHLWITQVIHPDFGAAYQRELQECPNIHLVGPLAMRRAAYYELADRCAYAIFPSCAEGQPGSVVECMHHGLIPVVSAESHLDTDGFGITLADCRIETIRATVEDLARRPAEWRQEMFRAARREALREHSEVMFVDRVRQVIVEAEAAAQSRVAGQRLAPTMRGKP